VLWGFFFYGNLLISEQNDTVKTIILPPTLAKRHLSYALLPFRYILSVYHGAAYLPLVII